MGHAAGIGSHEKPVQLVPKGEVHPEWHDDPVAVENHAGIHRHVLEAGLAEAKQLYRLAGVRTEWPVTKRPGTVVLPRPDTSGITVVLLGHGMSSLGTKQSVPGAAPRGSAGAPRHVYIFTHRIKAFALLNELPLARISVMSSRTRIGHVLLPDAGHAKVGLMQAVTRATAMHTGALRSLFTTEENRAIRDFISRRPNVRATKADFVEEALYLSEARAVTAQAVAAAEIHWSAP